jgi:ABC-2 type transport system permease protein
MAIARRELLDMFSNRRILFSLGMFLVFWGIFAAPRFIRMGRPFQGSDMGIFYLSTVLSVYVVLILVTQAFLNEKRDGRIEALLCTPVDLRTFWLGKILGVVFPGYCVALLVALVVVMVSALIHHLLLLPSLPLLVYLVLVLPAVLGGFSGLLGFLQLFFGMRENRIFNMILFILIFGLMGLVGIFVGPEGSMSWIPVLIVLAGAGALNFASFYLTRFLNKEKIITSMEV